MSKQPYYVCELVNGDYLYFDELCNNLTTWCKDTVIEFRHRFEDGELISLGFIPVNQIRNIINNNVSETIERYSNNIAQKPGKDPYWVDEDGEDDNPFYRME